MLEKIKQKGEYLERGIKYSAFGAVVFFIIVSLVLEELFFGAIASFVVFCSILGFWVYAPKAKIKKRAAEVEKELPFALMAMAVELNIGIAFEKAMEGISKNNYGEVSREFEKALKEIKHAGSSVQEALLRMGERVESLSLKRSLSQLSSIYEHSSSRERGEPIKRLAREMIAKQRAQSKEFSGKLVIFSIIFIALSAIIPALFQAFIIVGSMFLEIELTALQVGLIIAVGFPLLDIGVLFYIRSKTPAFLRG